MKEERRWKEVGKGKKSKKEKEDLICSVSGINTHTVADSELLMVSWLLTFSPLVQAESSARFQWLGNEFSGEVTYPENAARRGRPKTVIQGYSQSMPASSFRTVMRKSEYVCKLGRVRKRKEPGGNIRGGHCHEGAGPLGSSSPRKVQAFPCQLRDSFPCFSHGIIIVPTQRVNVPERTCVSFWSHSK